jgi:hypothetical protein
LVFGGIGHAQETGATPYGLSFGSPDTFAEFHGFVYFESFDFQKDGKGTDAGGPGTSSLDLHNFYFNALAKIRKNVTAFADIVYEHGGTEMALFRASIDWSLHPEYLTLRVGKFYSPFGLEMREFHAPVRRLVSRPLMMSALLFNEWTEAGVNAYGQIKSKPVGFTYDIALVNGPGGDTIDSATGLPILIANSENARQNMDNNSNKDLIARVSVPAELGSGLAEIGASWAGGRYSSTNAPEKLDFSLMGVDAQFKMAGSDLRGEYVKRKADAPAGTTVDSKSYYVQASYRAFFNQEGLNYLEPVIRYDYLDPNEDIQDDETTRIVLGFNYSPYPHFVIRLEYQNNDEKPQLENNGFFLGAVVDF